MLEVTHSRMKPAQNLEMAPGGLYELRFPVLVFLSSGAYRSLDCKCNYPH